MSLRTEAGIRSLREWLGAYDKQKAMRKLWL